jgi:DNA-binding GntR family transcriptional regulator
MSLPDLAPVRPRTLSDEAAQRLRSAIRSGVLRPGIRLVERDLAERLGMSRIPIREAIQRLSEEGLIVKLAHRGAFVYGPTRKEIEEISSLRVVLERFVVERVIANWTPTHETHLRQIVQTMRQAGAQNDLQLVYEHDFLFHSALWEIAEHNLLLEVVSSLRSRINRFLHEANGALTSAELELHICSHDDLIDVIQQGHVPTAQDEITRHVLGAKSRILTYCALPE